MHLNFKFITSENENSMRSVYNNAPLIIKKKMMKNNDKNLDNRLVYVIKYRLLLYNENKIQTQIHQVLSSRNKKKGKKINYFTCI